MIAREKAAKRQRFRSSNSNSNGSITGDLDTTSTVSGSRVGTGRGSQSGTIFERMDRVDYTRVLDDAVASVLPEWAV